VGLSVSGWFLAAGLGRGLVGFRGGRRLLFLHTTLVLPLVDSDDLVDQGVELFCLSNCSESILNGLLETDVKEYMLRLIVEVKGGDNLLEFDRIRGGRLGLLESRQLVSGLVLQVAIEIEGVESLLEFCEIVTMRMVFSFEDGTCQIATIFAKVRDNEKDFLFVCAVLSWLHREREETLGHECAIFRNFAVEVVRFIDLGFAGRFGCGCRSKRTSALETGNGCALTPDFSTRIFERLQDLGKDIGTLRCRDTVIKVFVKDIFFRTGCVSRASCASRAGG
jgi:hypothetical protein